MKFRFQEHSFEVQDQIAWAITKLSGHGAISVLLGNNKSFTANVESHNFQTKQTNGNIEIEAIEVFGTRSYAAQVPDNGDTRDINTSNFSTKLSLWNMSTRSYLEIFGDSALSIMGYPHDRTLKIDSTEYRIEFSLLTLHATDQPGFNQVSLLGTIERV